VYQLVKKEIDKWWMSLTSNQKKRIVLFVGHAKIFKKELNDVIIEAKKEVFDDIEKFIIDINMGNFDGEPQIVLELEEIKKRFKSNENPMILKKELAFRVTSELKDIEGAKSAQEYFESVFQNKSTDTKLDEITVRKEEYNILELITETNLSPSKAQARRLVEQGAIKINDEKVVDWKIQITLTQPLVLKVGKRILKITYQP